MAKNYGLDLEREEQEQDGTEKLAGAIPICLAVDFDKLSFEEQKRYFPMGEVQRSDKGDMQDCASRDKNNRLESKMNFLIRNDFFTPLQLNFLQQYLNEKGEFESSDAWIAMNSNTTKAGNSLKAPALALHKKGPIPKKILPLESWMTWEDYHNKDRLTDEMTEIGLKFMEIIGEIFFGKEYDFDQKRGLCTGLYAWGRYDENGVYQRTENPFTHAVYLPASDDPKVLKQALDNYRDSFDGNFIKDLAPDYKLYKYGYDIVIGPVKKSKKKPNTFGGVGDLVARFMVFFASIIGSIIKWK